MNWALGSIYTMGGETKDAHILVGKLRLIKALGTPTFRSEGNITIDLAGSVY
jgi:hypothetical protein